MNWLETLNPAQREAVQTLDGAVLVLAGAGSGKTQVVIYRIINLIKNGVEPDQILGLTFTNKAAAEMRERIKKHSQHDVLILTFHSLGARILRESIHLLEGYQRSFTIYDADDSEKLIKTCLDDLGIAKAKGDVKALKQAISNAKNNFIGPDQVSRERSSREVSADLPQVYALYERKLLESNALDYDDLLVLPVKLFRACPEVLARYQARWTHLLIDEYQDTNAVQYMMVQHLIGQRRNLCVVGDPDQSIYSWRGANINNILNFEMDYPGSKVIRLEQNYRSHSTILEAANALISNNVSRYEKRLWSALGPGEKIKLVRHSSDSDEASWVSEKILQHHHYDNIPLSQIVVFYRTNAQSRPFEDYLLSRRIPYVIVGGTSFYQRREVKDILAWLRVAQSGSDVVSFERTVNLPKRGLGDAAIERVRQGSIKEGLPILDFCEQLLAGEVGKEIKLTAKNKSGLEEYLRLVKGLQVLAERGSISDAVQAAIETTGYKDYLHEDPDSAPDRLENLGALVTKAVEWEEQTEAPTLAAFLEELSLKSSMDEADSSGDKVSLMTIHNGKGLEFTTTFLVGMEEDLFPHVNSRENDDALEEERRLCYVGVTRAKRYLYMTYAITRRLWGTTRAQRPSRFLYEIPRQYIEKL